MKKLMLVCLSGIMIIPVKAQLDEKNTKWMEYLEEQAVEETEEGSLEDLSTDLSYLADHPFNLHTVTRKDLERLPFLSDLQIENLLYYIYRYSPLTSIYELRNVDGLDLQTIEYLLPFIYLGEKKDPGNSLSLPHVLKYAKQEILFRYDNCLQQKSGYRDDPEDREAHPSRYYVGEKYYTSFKYGFQYKERLQFGFVTEKDPGEALMNAQHKGFDYYLAHFVLRETGILKYLIAGDYRVSFGQGLVLNTDYSLVNSSDVINISKKPSAIKRHYSTNEANYFRGAALTLGIDRSTLSLFYSQRTTDASVDDSTIISFKTDGYRRLPNDLLKKDRGKVRVAGGNYSWQNDFITAGLTAVYYDFGGKLLNPEPKPYNIYYLRDTYNYNAGINYLLRKKRFVFQGETAVGKNGALACTHAFHIRPASFMNVVLSQRYYGKDYQAMYASASGSSMVQNETGYYLGMSLLPFRYWKISASVDWAEYPWLKYMIDIPSRSTNILFRLDYMPRTDLGMNLQFRQKEKMRNISLSTQATKAVLPVEQQGLRYQVNYHSKSGFAAKTQINYSIYEPFQQALDVGYMFSQALGYASATCPFQGDIYVAYFHTDDWDTRISAYEKNILYAFSAPSFYGEGMRYCLTFKWTISRALSFYAKTAWTHYFDREEISSGPEAIEGKDKTDIYCLFRWKF